MVNMNNMENNKPELKLSPMAMERINKLKVFAISSIKKDVPPEIVKGKTSLSLIFTYTLAEAIHAASVSLKHLGASPEDYTINFQVASAPLDQFVTLPLEVKEEIKAEVVASPESYMIGNIRTVFHLVGNKEDKEVAEKIIKKFEVYAKKHKNK